MLLITLAQNKLNVAEESEVVRGFSPGVTESDVFWEMHT